MRKPFKKLHSMREFGTVVGATQTIRVNRLEQRLKPLVPFPHRHAFYHLVAVTSGSGWHEIDFQRYEVSPGTIFFMKPGQVHSWHLSEQTQGYVIEFEESALPKKGIEAKTILKILDSCTEHYDPGNLNTEALNKAFDLLGAMVSEYESQYRNFELSLKNYLIVMFVELARMSSGAPNRSAVLDPFLDRFFSVIEKNYQRAHEVAFYAHELSVTPKTLTMRASRAYGKSARKLIQERLILESKRMLAYSNLSVAEIGYELGFEDPNYFTRFFRVHAGSAPGEFRNKVRQLSSN